MLPKIRLSHFLEFFRVFRFHMIRDVWVSRDNWWSSSFFVFLILLDEFGNLVYMVVITQCDASLFSSKSVVSSRRDVSKSIHFELKRRKWTRYGKSLLKSAGRDLDDPMFIRTCRARLRLVAWTRTCRLTKPRRTLEKKFCTLRIQNLIIWNLNFLMIRFQMLRSYNYGTTIKNGLSGIWPFLSGFQTVFFAKWR